MGAGRYADDLEVRAGSALPEPVMRYFRQGARDGVSTSEAVEAWRRHRLVPRVLRDVTEVSLESSLLGASLRLPVGIAPTTLHRAAHPDGEVGTARAAAEVGVPLVLSSNAGSTFEDIGATGASWWLQLYVTADRAACEPVLEQAVAAGASAVVLTADTPVVGTKYDDGPVVWEGIEPGWLRVNFPRGYGAEPGDEKATDLVPDDLGWLARSTGLPVVVKGVLHPADARTCVQAGAAGVWVSNHGGRQLDGVVSTADRVAAVAEAVAGEVPVLVDGGIRSAREVLVALCLGADAVFLGRQPLYALAADGPDGVRRLLEELAADLEEALRLLGCASVEQLGPYFLSP